MASRLLSCEREMALHISKFIMFNSYPTVATTLSRMQQPSVRIVIVVGILDLEQMTNS